MQLKPVDCDLWKVGCNAEARYFFQGPNRFVARCVKHLNFQTEGEKILSRDDPVVNPTLVFIAVLDCDFGTAHVLLGHLTSFRNKLGHGAGSQTVIADLQVAVCSALFREIRYFVISASVLFYEEKTPISGLSQRRNVVRLFGCRPVESAARCQDRY